MNFDKSELNFRSYRGFSLRRTDPFGFWHVENHKDPEFQQSFTTLRAAISVIDSYLNLVGLEKYQEPKVREKLKRI